MKTPVIIGLSLLSLAWVALGILMLNTSGFNLKNLILLAMSGIIIFVPLKRKYFDPPKK